MDDTLRELATSAERLLSRTDQRARTRRLRDLTPSFERATWNVIAEAGWLGALVSNEDGGLGLGLAAAASLSRVVGSQLLPEPFVSGGALPAMILAALPNSAERTRLLAALLDGSRTVGVAWQSDTPALELTPTVAATVAGELCSLHGKTYYVEPATADEYLVLAHDNGAPLIVAARASSTAMERRIDGQLVAALTFDGERGAVLGRGPEALQLFAAALDRTRILMSAELVGLARRALEITLEYVRVRTQFGKPIGSFQALQHRLVDALTQISLASATVDEVLSANPENPARLAALASRAKARSSSAALQVTRLGIQLHGAMGNTDECEVGLYFKRAHALAGTLGSVPVHRSRFYELARPDVTGGHQTANAGPLPTHDDYEAMSDETFKRLVLQFVEQNHPAALRHFPRPAHWDEIKDWYIALGRRGWGAPHWPKEHGGMGLSPGKLMAFHDAMEEYGVARWIDNAVEMLGPLLIRFGTAEQRARYLPKILTGEERWCQGYSEPGAGSDLASLQTTAVLDGDHFVVNGRKIWTSHAQEATNIFMLVRTDKSGPPQRGISFLLAEMNLPGMTVRTIRDLADDHPFCEVTFDDVRIPKANLVGELNGGWTIAKALLGFERLFVANPAPIMYAMSQLTRFAKHRGLFEDPAFRARYAELALDVSDLTALYNQFADILKRGEQPGAEMSMLKVCSTETWQRVALFLSEITGELGTLLGAQNVAGEPLQLLSPLLNALPSSIYAGSNEIQRNIVARQVLKLPT